MFLLLLLGCSGCGNDLAFETGFRRFDSGGSSAGLPDVTVDDDGMGFRVYCGGDMARVVAFADGVVRLTYGATTRDSYAVLPPATDPELPSILLYSDVIVMRTSTMGVIVDPSDCRVTVENSEGDTILEEPAGGGYSRGGGGTYVLSRSLAEDEHIYGLGERTGGLDRVGGRYTCRTTRSRTTRRTAGGAPRPTRSTSASRSTSPAARAAVVPSVCSRTRRRDPRGTWALPIRTSTR